MASPPEPPAAPSPSWSSVLRALREARGVTQEGWAALLGYSEATARRWERGSAVPTAEAEAAIAEVCRERGLFRAYTSGPLAGLTLTPDLLRDLLAQARLGGAPEPTVARGEAAAPASPVAGSWRGSLPAALTSFVGREREVTAVGVLLAQGRLLTLTGPGGVGKTRLALQVAAEVQGEFGDGVRLVELAPITDAALVPDAVAAAAGVGEAPGVPLLDTLVASFRQRAQLLVLDNCEHLVEACAQLAERLLGGCPALRILATSREPLGLGGERQWRVPPLAAPDPDTLPSLDTLAAYPAVQLFVERARAVHPDFALTAANAGAVARVCARLDGLPLALELAAAWVRLLAVEQILARLDDALRLLTGGGRAAPTRQQTLQATLDWSYALLAEPERAVFRRLAAFSGGCRLEAAEAVCGEDVLEILGRLVDKSLVQVDGGEPATRFRLLEPVRQYAARHLAASGEREQVAARHAAFYLTLAEQAAPELRGAAQLDWLARLEREHDNLRAALHWTQEHGEADAALRLSVALVPFWEGRGHLSEGRRWLHAALDAPRASAAPSAQRTRALLGAGALAEWQGDLSLAGPLLEECLRLARAEDDLDCVAWSTAWLGVLQVSRGDIAGALPLFEESLHLFQSLEDPPGIAFALLDLGIAVAFQGDAAWACHLLEESLQLFRALGDTRYVAIANTMLGYALAQLGDATRAATLIADGLAGHWEVGDRTYLAYGLVVMAGVLNRLKQPVRAVRLLGAAEALREALGGPLASSTLTQEARLVAALRRKLDEAEFELAWAAGRALPLEAAVGEALTTIPLPAPSDVPSAAVPTEILPEPLTPREREVARLLAEGYSDRQIAEALTIALSTVGSHVHHLLAKLGVHSRFQVADWALAHGLAATDPD